MIGGRKERFWVLMFLCISPRYLALLCFVSVRLLANMPSKKKLSRSKARELDVKEIVHEIEQPKAPLALRLSAMLMRGVVQLYSTQVREECIS